MAEQLSKEFVVEKRDHEKDEHSHWGTVFMVSGTLAMVSLLTAVLWDGVIAGVFFTFVVIGFLFYLAIMKEKEVDRQKKLDEHK